MRRERKSGGGKRRRLKRGIGTALQGDLRDMNLSSYYQISVDRIVKYYSVLLVLYITIYT
jgi:hypothetical protein